MLPDASTRELPTCRLIATGGTIAMTVDPATGAASPALSGEALRASVPGLAGVAHLDVHDASNVPSAYMGPDRWIALHRVVQQALACEEVAGVVVTHGTDTLEETAWFLDLTLSPAKPVIVVGAQRNASAADFDGPGNLLAAVRVCLAPEACGLGVMVVMNGQVHAAREVTKTHTTAVASFQSGAAGLLGTVDADRVVFLRAPLRRQHIGLAGAPLPRVDIVPVYAGADGALVRAAVAAGARGIVVQALGCGNVGLEVHLALVAALALGVCVVVSSRVPHGRVLPLYGFEGGGHALKAAGAVFAGDLSPHKARIMLMLALQSERTADDLQRLLDR